MHACSLRTRSTGMLLAAAGLLVGLPAAAWGLAQQGQAGQGGVAQDGLVQNGAAPGSGLGSAGPAVNTDAAEAFALSQAQSLSLVFKRAARIIEPSVVHITTEQRVRSVPRNIFGMPLGMGDEVLRQSGLGSGVIIDASQGLIITNNHVIENGDRLVARLYDGREIEAELVGRDEATDLAVLRVQAEGLVAARLGDSDALEVGEWVLAAGSPFGFDQTVTAGIVSAKGRTGIGGQDPSRFQEFIQTDASINPGNSGGPLVNLQGEVVGINSAIATRGGGSVGIGFAIPSNMARRVTDFLVQNGRVERGWLGVESTDLPAEDARAMGLGIGEGARVARVVPGSPAEDAGLREGDVVLAINGERVLGFNRLRNIVSLIPPGERARLDLFRGGRRETLDVTVGDRQAAQLASLADQVKGRAVETLGVVLAPTTPDLARQLGYLRSPGGEVVAYVDPAGPAAEAGLQVGDVVLNLNERRAGGGKRSVRLDVLRRGERGTLEIEVSGEQSLNEGR